MSSVALHAVLRATTCDTLETFEGSSTIAVYASSAQRGRFYFIPKAVTSSAPVPISAVASLASPAGTFISIPISCPGVGSALLIVKTAHPRQLFLVSASASAASLSDLGTTPSKDSSLTPPSTPVVAPLSSTDAPILSVPTPRDIISVEIHRGLLIVRCDDNGVCVYRLDSMAATSDDTTPSIAALHLGSFSGNALSTSADTETGNVQWFASVSPRQSGLQELLVVSLNSVTGDTSMVIADVASNVATLRGAPLCVSGKALVEGLSALSNTVTTAAQVVSFHTAWGATRRFTVIFEGARHVVASIPFSSKQPQWSMVEFSAASPSSTASLCVKDMVADASGAWWICVDEQQASTASPAALAATPAGKRGRSTSQQPPANVTTTYVVQLRSDFAVASGKVAVDGDAVIQRLELPREVTGEGHVVLGVSAEGETVHILKGKYVMSVACPLPVASSTPEPSTAMKGLAGTPSLEARLMSQRCTPSNSSSVRVNTKAEQWVAHLMRFQSSQPSSSPPTMVLRDSDYYAYPGHVILDALEVACNGAKDPVAWHNALMAYFHLSSGVCAGTLVHVARQVAVGHQGDVSTAAGVMLALWVLAASKGRNEMATEALIKAYLPALRCYSNDKISIATAEVMFLVTVEAALSAFQISALGAIPLAAGLCDALAVVYGESLAASAACLKAWHTLARVMKEFGNWCLDAIAPRMGMLTAHCGTAFTAKKEAQFIPNVATRITTTKEADIKTHTIILKGSGAV